SHAPAGRRELVPTVVAPVAAAEPGGGPRAGAPAPSRARERPRGGPWSARGGRRGGRRAGGRATSRRSGPFACLRAIARWSRFRPTTDARRATGGRTEGAPAPPPSFPAVAAQPVLDPR